MKTIEHWIGEASTPGVSARTADVYIPATGQVQARVLLAGPADVGVEIITRFPSRIGYVHIKQMDPLVAKPKPIAARTYTYLNGLASQNGGTA
jgi:hypothetical protein